MNTTEQIVESYFRVCKECFTVPDVKVHSGYGRQFDLLAYCLRDNQQYHVEIQVSHSARFAPDSERLFQEFDRKFFGVPRRTDAEKRPGKKSYIKEIWATYRWYGFQPAQVKRIWVCWTPPAEPNFDEALGGYNKRKELQQNPITIVSFRNTIVPELMRHVRTAHYEDVSLRTLSLLRQCRIQTNIAREKERQRKLHPD